MKPTEFVNKVLIIRRDILSDDVKSDRIFYNLGFGCINLKASSGGKIILQDLLAIFIKDSSFAHFVKLNNFKIKDVLITRDEEKIYMKPSSEPGSLLINITIDSKNGMVFKGDTLSLPFWSIPYLISIQYNNVFNINRNEMEKYKKLFINEDYEVTVNQIYKDNKDILSKCEDVKESVEILDTEISKMKIDKNKLADHVSVMDNERLYMISDTNQIDYIIYCMEKKYFEEWYENHTKEISGYQLFVTLLSL